MGFDGDIFILEIVRTEDLQYQPGWYWAREEDDLGGPSIRMYGPFPRRVDAENDRAKDKSP